MVSDYEFGWLAGIIDGEGCFNMTSNGNGRNCWSVMITIVNTDELTILEIESILKRLGIQYTKRHHAAAKTRRPCWRIEIQGLDKVKKALDILFPYIKCKQNQAKVLLDYVTTRLNMPSHGIDQSVPRLAHYLLQEMKGM